jgi:hypothetical protein
MRINPVCCSDDDAEKLMKICRKNYSYDTEPFYMSQLVLADLNTKSPITGQTSDAALAAFLEDLPTEEFKEHLNPGYFENGKIQKSIIGACKITDFEKNLEGWLSGYKNQVRSPISKDKYLEFKNELYKYLGRPKFYYIVNQIFVTKNYFCDNINAIILTQNHGRYPVDKIAMFSFFSPD